jgi:hypothetical protein
MNAGGLYCMEKFNSENLISSLFALGFEQVDFTLYTLVLEKILLEQGKNKQFEFVEEAFTSQFSKYVYFDGHEYKLKDGLTFGSEVKMFNDEKYTLKQFFGFNGVNKKLIEYLQHFDFRDVIIQKINLVGVDRIDELSGLFCNKEKNIIYVMFGIEEMQRGDAKKSMEAYDRIYNQENVDVDNAIKKLTKKKVKQ